MVETPTASPDLDSPSRTLDEEESKLATAYAQATAEVARLQERASTLNSEPVGNEAYSQHDVEGVGRYVIPRRTGWKNLLDIIHDPKPNIDFSANIYPAFDGIIGQHFQSPYLLDPLDGKYESYENLRDNLAAVRNFLMESYYANDNSGMSPAQAKAALAEIAGFVGDGLYNNFLYAGIIPNHDWRKPFISISEASEPGGHGAQYIYERILAHQRSSSWLRPFDAVLQLLGGKPHMDWKLPEAEATHFTDWIEKDIAPTQVSANPKLDEVNAAIVAASAKQSELDARLAAVRDAKALSNTAHDLDDIGNHLIYAATNMEGVAHLDEPVRRNAVDIAKDILRKLKLNLGSVNVVDGLKLKPSDDMATLGAIKAVSTVYERLLAWARGTNDTSIFQNPSVIAATQAIGQLGYMAKREALRLAELSGNTKLAGSIGEQIRRLPESFKPKEGTTLGSLVDKVQSGIDTIMTRTQQVSVSGGQVGQSVDSKLGSSMAQNPTAGTGKQAGADAATKRNQQALMGDQQAALQQANQINAQLAAQARSQQAQQPQGQGQNQPAAAAKPAQSAPRSTSTVGRQALGNARQRQTTAPTVTTTTTAPAPAPLTPAQAQAAQRSATSIALANAARERAEQERTQQEMQRQQQLLNQQRANDLAKAKAAINKLDPAMLKGMQSATSTQGLVGAPITGGRKIDPKSVQASINKATQTTPPASGKPLTPEEQLRQQQALQALQPTAPNRGGGRGV
jgi:hypothetical protein